MRNLVIDGTTVLTKTYGPAGLSEFSMRNNDIADVTYLVKDGANAKFHFTAASGKNFSIAFSRPVAFANLVIFNAGIQAVFTSVSYFPRP